MRSTSVHVSVHVGMRKGVKTDYLGSHPFPICRSVARKFSKKIDSFFENPIQVRYRAALRPVHCAPTTYSLYPMS
jgi:hypothetical protein